SRGQAKRERCSDIGTCVNHGLMSREVDPGDPIDPIATVRVGLGDEVAPRERGQRVIYRREGVLLDQNLGLVGRAAAWIRDLPGDREARLEVSEIGQDAGR